MGLRAPRKKNLGLPGSAQPPFGTLIYKLHISLGIPVHLCHFCDKDTPCVTQSTYANYSVPEPWHALNIYRWKRWLCFGTIFSIRMDLFFRKVSSYKQDSVWSWFICFCYTICMIFVDGLTFSLGVFFPVLMDSFNESRERTGKLNYYYNNCC